MLDYGYTHYIIYIGERLGNPSEERITRCTLEEAANKTFVTPNCVMLTSPASLPIPPSPSFGLPDEDFAVLDGRSGMMTKMPIRLLSLQAMNLAQSRVMWDIGFCTGCVSIEAKRMFPMLDIVAFERREEGRKLMAAMFIGKEKEDDSLFNDIALRYNTLKAKVDSVGGKRPTIFSGEMHGGNWHAVGGKNYLAQIFRDAGADYVINDENTGGIPLEFESMYAKAANADYWRVLKCLPTS